LIEERERGKYRVKQRERERERESFEIFFTSDHFDMNLREKL